MQGEPVKFFAGDRARAMRSSTGSSGQVDISVMRGALERTVSPRSSSISTQETLDAYRKMYRRRKNFATGGTNPFWTAVIHHRFLFSGRAAAKESGVETPHSKSVLDCGDSSPLSFSGRAAAKESGVETPHSKVASRADRGRAKAGRSLASVEEPGQLLADSAEHARLGDVERPRVMPSSAATSAGGRPHTAHSQNAFQVEG